MNWQSLNAAQTKVAFASRTNSILHEVAQTNFCLATSDACKISFNRQWRGKARKYLLFRSNRSTASSAAFQKVIAKVVNIIRKDSSPVELSVDISEHECAGVEAKFAN